MGSSRTTERGVSGGEGVGSGDAWGTRWVREWHPDGARVRQIRILLHPPPWGLFPYTKNILPRPDCQPLGTEGRVWGPSSGPHHDLKPNLFSTRVVCVGEMKTLREDGTCHRGTLSRWVSFRRQTGHSNFSVPSQGKTSEVEWGVSRRSPPRTPFFTYSVPTGSPRVVEVRTRVRV